MQKIKLCGICRKEEVYWINALLPDYVGFVFYEKSRRYINPHKAKELRSMLNKEILSVGVFVDAEPELIERLYLDGIINAAQLHGSENESYIEGLRENAPGIYIIQAFKPSSAHRLETAEKSTADMLLLDSGMGSGRVFNWSMLKGFKRPYILAGGLSPENVSEAISELSPYGLDVSSGIEINGKKDKKRMEQFVVEVRK